MERIVPRLILLFDRVTRRAHHVQECPKFIFLCFYFFVRHLASCECLRCLLRVLPGEGWWSLRVLWPRSRDMSVTLSPSLFHSELTGVQESSLEVFQGILSIFSVFKSNKAELSSLGASEHNLGVSDSILVVSLEVFSKFTFFQVLRQVLYYQSGCGCHVN